MYILQSLHGDLSGFHFLIIWQKNCSAVQYLISKGSKLQILHSSYDNVSVLYNIVFTLYEQKLTS